MSSLGTDATARRPGGASGIGVDTVRVLAEAGSEVTIAVRNLEAVDKVAAELNAAGGHRPVPSGIRRLLAQDHANGGGWNGTARQAAQHAMTMSKLDNVAGVLALADQLQLDVPAVADMIWTRHGRSRAAATGGWMSGAGGRYHGSETFSLPLAALA
jgi:NAD(P)-dependent dehydrogenase (short-subunit alcohol dehydrogenase family)